MSSNEKPPKIQRLPPEEEYRCDNCGRTVHFRVVRTQPMRADPRRCYAYLVCPLCGARAVQVRRRRI